ncbi:MAG: LacI family transcriptional regulator [Candidatus Promineifilaceae bacterium]|jgi:LacI family transcriptional regulator
MGRPTQKDVAELAGVSRATVSYVINKRSGGKVRITDETKLRVMSAIEHLGYQPNVMARSLRTQQTHLIAVMVADLTNPYYPLLVRGVQTVANQNDYQILIYDCNDDPEQEKAFVDIMIGRRVDGIIMVPFYLSAIDLNRLTEANIEVAVVGSGPKIERADYAEVDEHSSVVELIQHLYDKGHRRIAHLAGRQDSPPGLNRLNAYKDILAKLNIPYDESLVRYGEFHREGVKELTLSLFPDRNQKDRPTALFAANDIMAIEALQTLTARGWRVPEDIAICGYDNIPRSQVAVPALTTVDQSAQLRGQTAAELLLGRLQKKGETIASRSITVPSSLIIRNST